jgi:hypothetical protein
MFDLGITRTVSELRVPRLDVKAVSIVMLQNRSESRLIMVTKANSRTAYFAAQNEVSGSCMDDISLRTD